MRIVGIVLIFVWIMACISLFADFIQGIDVELTLFALVFGVAQIIYNIHTIMEDGINNAKNI